MEKSPLAVPFRLAMMRKTLDRLVAKFDACPLAFRDRKWDFLRERLARMTEALNDLIEAPPLGDGQAVITLENMWVQLDRLASTLGGRAGPGTRLGQAGTGY